MRTPAAAALALLAFVFSAYAQNIPIQDPDPAIARLGAHPSLLLGRRAEALRAARPVQRTLVIADSAHGAMDAIGGWRPGLTYPVLIDDGSFTAAADIARFVRAFGPDEIRIAGHDRAGRLTQDSLSAALASSWGVDAVDELPDAFEQAKWTPPGVVVTDPDHPASIAALALAAGRGQPLVFVDAKERTGNGILPDPQRDALTDAIREGVEALPWDWRGIGDEIDALTLCLSTDARVRRPGADTTIAITDHLGRHPGGRRWAYAGWLSGTAADALYDAACALFLTDPGSAWIFDGYEKGFAAPYECDDAADMLNRAGITAQLVAPPNNTPGAWRARTRLPVAAGLIHVNTSGDPRRFQLGGHAKRAYASDIPTLARPAIVHFIHSYSAQQPASPETIAARWLDEGAYAYLGSVDEPMLGAFAPPSLFIGRMLGGGAFGAAARRDEIGPWRTQVIGDPLTTISRATPPEPEHPRDLSPLPELSTLLKQHAGELDLTRTIRTLLILDRADEATALVRAALDDDDPKAPTLDADAALYATLLAERTADAELMARIARRLPASTWDEPRHSARLWRTLRPALIDPDVSLETVMLLARARRPESAADDAQALLPALTRLLPRERVDATLGDLKRVARFDEDKRRIDAMLGAAR